MEQSKFPNLITSINRLAQQLRMDSLQNPNRKLQLLENQHEQLEQTLKERTQLLRMNLNILKQSAPSSLDLSNQSLIDSLLASQTDISSSFIEQLLNNQIQVQQQCEMLELIKNYERRIADLRAHLINKEAQVSYEMYDTATQSALNRQNIQLLNIEALQKQTIRKHLLDYKKITVEVQALEHTLQIYTLRKDKQPKPRSQINTNKIFNQQLQQKQRPAVKSVTTAQQKSNKCRKQLLDQVLNSFRDEQQRQTKLKKELGMLKSDWEKTNICHKKLIKQYKNTVASKSKTGPCKKQTPFLSFLDSKGQDPIVHYNQFSKKDTNLQEPNNRAAKPTTYLMHKQKKNPKQNQ